MSRRLHPTPVKATQARRARRRGLVPAAPPPAGNTRALKTGAQADGRNLPGHAENFARVSSVIAEDAPWIQPTDTFAVESFVSIYTAFHYTEAALARLTPTALLKKHKAARVNVQRGRLLNEMARDLGLTPAGRAKLGLTVAKTERELSHVRPVRSEERAIEVAEILQRARALPPTTVTNGDSDDVDNINVTSPAAEGEVIPLHDVNAADGDGGKSMNHTLLQPSDPEAAA